MKKYCYDYPMPAVTTDCIIIRKSENPSILLIHRKHDPYKERWALPGGFVEIDEDLEEGALRELEEETGISGISIAQYKTFGKPGRDPRGRTISVIYYAFLDTDVMVQAGDDASLAEWFDLNNLPPLAFDHNEILEAFRSSKQI